MRFLMCFLVTGNLWANTGQILHKNIPYLSVTDKDFDPERHVLDVYTPKIKNEGLEVLIFIHGGNWDAGKKDTYRFFGKGLASKGRIAVIINYRLSPKVNYLPMSMDCANAVKWVYDHIEEYGGDKNKIVISGHSAGGHLAALIANDNSYFERLKMDNHLKGCILIDAFGLDMYSYFPTSTYKKDGDFKKVFTDDPETWKKASPVFHLSATSLPHLVLLGTKTYPGIKTQEYSYEKVLAEKGIRHSFIPISGKGHFGMILQFYWKCNKNYNVLTDFMSSCFK